MKDTLKTCIIILGAGLLLSVILFIFNLTGGVRNLFEEADESNRQAIIVTFQIIYYARDLLFLLPILIFFNAFRKQL